MPETKNSKGNQEINRSQTGGHRTNKSSGGKTTVKKSAGGTKHSVNNMKASASRTKSNELEVKVLNELYKNADTGKSSVDNVIKKIEDTNLRSLLLSHYEGYNEISGKIAAQLNKKGETPKVNNVFGKAVLWGSMNINTLFDKTSSHIADIMIQGNNSGIVSINKELNNSSDSLSSDTLKLASELLSFEQKNVKDLTTYL